MLHRFLEQKMLTYEHVIYFDVLKKELQFYRNIHCRVCLFWWWPVLSWVEVACLWLWMRSGS